MHCSLPVLLFRVPTTFRHCLARHASRTTRRISAVPCCTTRKPCVSIQHARRQWGWVWDIASWNSTSPRRLGECCVLVNIHGYEWVSNTHTHPFNGPFSGTTLVSRYQKGKTNLDFTEARDSEWQWHRLGRMQVCTLLQTDNHASIPLLSFLQAVCHSCRPTNSVKALE